MRIIIIITSGPAGDSAMIKTMTFAVVHFSIAFTVSYLLTGDVLVGSAIALVEPAVNTVGFHFHEKVWRRFELGRQGAANMIVNSY
jgi:uncharacterized membrane protein